jgi:hypothetical protein
MTTRYLSPDQVVDMVPGLTKGALAQLRFQGKGGPPWLNPTPKKIVYRESDIVTWLEGSERTRTGRVA